MAQVWGLLALRLSEASVLPFNQTVQARAMSEYIAEIATASKDTLDLTPLRAAAKAFASAAHAVGMEVSRGVPEGVTTTPLNDRLAFTERKFLVCVHGMSVYACAWLYVCVCVCVRVCSCTSSAVIEMNLEIDFFLSSPTHPLIHLSYIRSRYTTLLPSAQFAAELPGRKWFRHVLQAYNITLSPSPRAR